MIVDDISSILNIQMPEIPDSLPIDLSNIIKSVNTPILRTINFLTIPDSKNITEVLEYLNFDFPIIPTFLMLIEKYQDFDSQSSDILAIYVLYMYISCVLYANETNDYQYYTMILNSIPNLQNSKHFPLLQNCFFKIIQECINHPDCATLNTFFQGISDYSLLSCSHSPEFENILVSILLFVTSQNHDDKLIFIKFILELTKEKFQFNATNSMKIINLIEPHVIGLDCTAMQLFNTLSEPLFSDIILDIYKNIIDSLISFAKTTEMIKIPKIEKSTIDFIPNLNPKIIFEYSDLETFEDELSEDNVTIEQLPSNISLLQDSQEEIFKIISILTKRSTKCEDTLLSRFTVLNKINMNEILVLIYLIQDLTLSSQNCSTYISLILNSQLFDDTINPISDKIFYKIFIQSMNVLNESKFIGLTNIFKQKHISFFLCSIILKIIFYNFYKILVDDLCNEEFMNDIVMSSCYYQEQHKYANDENLQIIEESRKTIFKIFNEVVSNKSLNYKWFSNHNFVKHLLSLLMETSVRKFSENLIKKYLNCSESPIQEVFIQELLNVLTDFSNNFSDPIYIDLMTSLISICNSAKSINFSLLIDLIIEIITKIEPNSITFPLFEACIRFLTNSYMTHILDFNEITKISKTTQEFNKTKFKQQIDDLMQNLLYETNKIFIKNASILGIIVESSLDDNDLMQNLDFVYNILEKSIYNMKISHDLKFDLYLVEKLLKIKQENEDRSNVVSKIFSILSLSVSIFISEDIVSKIMNLLKPINKTRISQYQSLYISFVSDVFASSLKNTNYFTILNFEKSPLLINTNKFDKNFDIDMEMFLEVSDVPFRLLNFNDTKNSFDVDIKNGLISISAISDVKTIKNFNQQIDFNKWLKIKISITFEKDSAIFKLFYNNSTEIIIFSDISYKEDESILYSLYPLNQFYEFPIGYVSNLSISRNSEETEEILPILNSNLISFMFTNDLNLDNFIVLYLQPKYLTNNGLIIQNLFEKITSLFKNLFIISDVSQTIFLEKNFSEILSQILVQTKKTGYQEYLELYNEIFSVITIDELRNDFLKNIIMNLSIWSLADLLQIVNHWKSDVIVNHKNDMKGTLTIYDFTSFLRENFDEYSKEMSEILKTIMPIYIDIWSIDYDQSQLIYLIGECQVTTNIQIVKFLLSLTKSVTFSIQNVTISPETTKHFYLLHHLISYCDEMMFVDILEIFFYLNQKKLLNMSFDRHILSIVRSTPQRVCTKTVLKYLVRNINDGFIEFLPLCCLISCECDEVQYFLQAIENKNGLTSDNDRIMWLLILFDRFPDYQQQIFDLIFDEQKISIFCSLLHILQSPYLCETICCHFLTFAIDRALRNFKNLTQDYVNKLLYFCYLSILFQPKKCNDLFLENLMLQSPYTKKKQKRRSSGLFLPLYVKLDKSITNSLTDQFIYSLHMSENGGWLDSKFALKVIKLYEIFPCPELSSFDILTASYLMKLYPTDVNAHLNTIPFSYLELRNNYNLIMRFPNYKKYINFDLSMFESEYNAEIAFRCFEQIASCYPIQEIIHELMVKVKQIHEERKDEEKNIMTSIDKNIVENILNTDNLYVKNKAENRQKLLSEIKILIEEQTSENIKVFLKKKNDKKDSDLSDFAKNETEASSLPVFKIEKIKLTNSPSSLSLTEKSPIGELNLGKKEEEENQIEITQKEEMIYYEIRDDILVHGLPMKMKLNENYNDHKIASQRRDKGRGDREVFDFKKYKKPTETNCSLITIYGEFPCYLLLTNKNLIIKNEVTNDIIKTEELEMIRAVEYLHTKNGCEIFVKNGKSYFIVFNNEQIITKFSNLIPIDNLTEKWLNYEITNFEYIMEINRRTSRSFNVLPQYPIMPWIILDTKSETLEFQNLRDFGLNSGIMTHEKFLSFTEKKREIFYSAMINEMSVLYYLMRMEPFTSLHIQFQSGKFDHAKRLFQSLEETIDFDDFSSELIPEFYFSPEFLTNKNRFDLGLEDSNILLPKWCKSPIEFVYLNRKIMESSKVSENIDKWFDLIWGIDRKKENNKYDPSLYDDSPNPEMMLGMGVIPKQIFFKKHPKRKQKVNNSAKKVTFFKFVPLQSPKLHVTDKGEIEIVANIGENSVTAVLTPSFNLFSYILTNYSLRQSFSTKRFCYLTDNNKTITFFNSGKFTKSISFISDVIKIEMNNRITVCLTKDSILHVFTKNEFIDFSLFVYDTDISCLYVCSDYDTIVYGTKSGVICSISIRNQQIYKTASVDYSIEKIEISPGWGFIVCSNETEISVFDLNLNFIRTKSFDEGLVNWCLLKDIYGFDHIIAQFGNLMIQKAELFYLDFIYFGEFNKKVSSMIYSKQKSEIYMVSDDGHGCSMLI
ncbi:Beige/BEACH domain containing protein [Trichomonas vaginalis G3]|uniref:Beige/BEACH domain containing protein n=1 Tax=Trichomonas vaginalis (strain ATCC PRA-98 / G3) TaxID=412133 RepID=A2D799_TRIV3|nr:aggrephagy protein [Trichomonas vaginalis G3]EAY23616.1 Beige/BEACH domain containing protein [Trichomonas vaginalis G3]KAI5490109.1 aggrephagy protein [Trichomonas vaginalis G3]|eukprot:XP_001276864.1 Beige/BEACH domain containing protein [Trichomonas vaginalis G3]